MTDDKMIRLSDAIALVRNILCAKDDATLDARLAASIADMDGPDGEAKAILALYVEALRALPAVQVGVKPLEWQLEAAKGGPYYVAFDPLYGRQVEAPDEATCDAIDQTREARIRSALTAANARTTLAEISSEAALNKGENYDRT